MNNDSILRLATAGMAALCLLAASRFAFGCAAITNKTAPPDLHVEPAPGVVTLSGDMKERLS